MKSRTLLIGLALLIVLVGGFLWQRHAVERPLEHVGAVSISASKTLSATPIWLAQERGFFTRAGLDVTIRQVDTAKIGTETMVKGEVDLATATEFKAIQTAFARKDLRILGTTSFMHSTKLLCLKDKGIAAVAGIKGKRVGVNFGTSAEYHLARLLTLNGMTRGDIVWVNLKPQAMADALASGKVDAVIVWSPFTIAIEKKFGQGILAFDGQPGEDYYYVVLGRQDWLARHPKPAERVMLALHWAVEWMDAHPKEARAYMAAKFNMAAAEVDEEMIGSHFSIGLPQGLLRAMEAEGRWLVEQNAEGTPVESTLNLIAFAPLLAAAPQTVTMISGHGGKP